jgi:alpha-galactosidase
MPEPVPSQSSHTGRSGQRSACSPAQKDFKCNKCNQTGRRYVILRMASIFGAWYRIAMGSTHKPSKAMLKSNTRTIRLLALAVLLGGNPFSHAAEPAFWSWAKTPPLGWNSWDCYGAGVWQEDALANADYMARHLKSHGWNLVTIDIQWYEPLAHTTEYRKGAALEMDANGRLLPAPNRFPLTKDTRSFKPIADYLHAKGLKFGLHLMRGIPRQAVDRDNSPILGTPYWAADIADKKNVCRWNTDMYGVDMSKPGAQEYYDSVFALLASWELDYVKVDDLSAPRYQKAEVEAIRKAIDKTGRDIVLSTSPGATPVAEGAHVKMHANLWRISDDFWDSWGALYSQFARLNNWTPHRGPGHWPDADMIPFGNIRAWQTNGWTQFTKDEHYTLMTLWSIARSPLIFGGNLPKNDEFTLSLLTNDEVLAVNQNSANNRQLFSTNNQVAWVADVPGSKDKYLALFNTSPAPTGGRRPTSNSTNATPTLMRGTNAAGEVYTYLVGTNSLGGTVTAVTPRVLVIDNPSAPVSISVSLADLGLTGPAKVRDLWTHKEVGSVSGKFESTINSHGAGLYRVSPGN